MTTDAASKPDIDADITLDDLMEHVDRGETVDTSDKTEVPGHVLTVEHYGRFPPEDLLQNYLDVLHTALGEPDNFDEYGIAIESHHTTITRSDVPVSAYGTEDDFRTLTRGETRSDPKQAIFTAAADDTDATISEVAEQVGMTVRFVQQTLQNR